MNSLKELNRNPGDHPILSATILGAISAVLSFLSFSVAVAYVGAINSSQDVMFLSIGIGLLVLMIALVGFFGLSE